MQIENMIKSCTEQKSLRLITDHSTDNKSHMLQDTMEDKNNAVLALRPTTAKLEIQSGDAAESTVSSENQRRTGRTAQRVFVTALDVINHALIILVTSYLAYYAGKQYSITNVHVILCTIGVCITLVKRAFNLPPVPS